MMPKNDPKTLNAWAMYDWANSVYNLLITSAIFPIYYAAVTESAFGIAGKSDDGTDLILVNFFGFELPSDVLYSYGISFSFLLVALISPFLSGMADYGGRKKFFMKCFTYLGSMACIALYFFTGSNIEFGIAMSVLASLGFAGSIVFYNSFLPEIATEDRMDTVSAKGFTLGYIGSVLLLLVSLFFVLSPDLIYASEMEVMAAQLQAEGKSAEEAIKEAEGFYSGWITRYSFIVVGLWWASFAQIPFARLKELPSRKKEGDNLLTKGFKELQKVYRSLKNYDDMRGFLLSFFLYSIGVQTILLLATVFAQRILNIETSGLITIILIIQIIAIGGAYLFAIISKRCGNKFAIMVMLVIWLIICVCAYLVQTENQFYLLAIVVGMVMGGIQSLSRSTFSKLIPDDTLSHASYFSFYDVIEKLSLVIGTALYGIVTDFTGNVRNSAFVLMTFFVLGIIVLARTKIKRRDLKELND
ncbi:MAG: MFS transporter [Bacteroidota bacterium]